MTRNDWACVVHITEFWACVEIYSDEFNDIDWLAQNLSNDLWKKRQA